jgi:hypothetical protein
MGLKTQDVLFKVESVEALSLSLHWMKDATPPFFTRINIFLCSFTLEV